MFLLMDTKGQKAAFALCNTSVAPNANLSHLSAVPSFFFSITLLSSHANRATVTGASLMGENVRAT